MDKGEFRFAYFSSKYEETIDFYKNILEFNLKFSWDRGPNDKGSVFGHGLGLIEILKQPDNEQEFNLGLDHRSPKGSFMVIETSNIETIFSKYKKNLEKKKIREIKLKKLEEKNEILKEKKELKILEEKLQKENNKINLRGASISTMS